MNADVKSGKSEGADSEERVKEKYKKKDKRPQTEVLTKRTAKRVRTWWKRDGKEDGIWESKFFRPLLTLPETQTKECGLFMVPAL